MRLRPHPHRPGKPRRWLPALALAAGLLSPAANAADISAGPKAGFPFPVITLSGEIDDGDDKRFAALAARHPQAAVYLDSIGGNVDEGLKIAKLIRQKGYPTVVMDGNTCASMCAIIWLAGSTRYADDSAEIGFHAAYYEEDGETRESGSGNAVLGAFLGSLGLSDDTIIYFTEAAPESMTWLDLSDSDELGLDIRDVSTFVTLAHASPAKPAPSHKPKPDRAEPVKPSPGKKPPAASDTLEAAAETFVRQYFASWSGNDAQALAFIKRAYADHVLFYGEATEKSAISDEKQAMLKRWPERSYTARASSLETDCDDSPPASCLVRVTVDWEVQNARRNTGNRGATEYTMALLLPDGQPRILKEAGQPVKASLPESPSRKDFDRKENLPETSPTKDFDRKK